MIGSIAELPPQVRNSLDEHDQEVFLKAYNEMDPKNEEEVAKARRMAWRVCKELPSSFSFRITASVEVVDNDRDLMDIDSVMRNMNSFISAGGNIQQSHNNYSVGTIWDWEPVTKAGKRGVAVWGNLYGGDKVYDATRVAFVNGFNSMSIGGVAGNNRYTCDERGCYVKREVQQLMEISLCPNPTNRFCTLEWYNTGAKLTKSDGGVPDGTVRFGVDEYEIHRDFTACPLMAIKKALRDIGVESHATKDGVRVRMDTETFAKAAPIIHGQGLVVYYDGPSGEAVVNTPGYILEHEFKKGYDKGYIRADGYLTADLCKADFVRLYRNGLIERNGDGFRMMHPLD